MRSAVKTFLLLPLLLAPGCGRHVGTFSVGGDARPRFTFYGSSINSLHVYRVPRRYVNKGIPLSVLAKVNPDTQWFVEGPHDAAVPVSYGVAPEEMKEIARAKPLAEGEIYFALVYISTEASGAFVGQYFKTQGGRTIQVNELVDEKTLNDFKRDGGQPPAPAGAQ